MGVTPSYTVQRLDHGAFLNVFSAFNPIRARRYIYSYTIEHTLEGY